ncbi:uncharacterized protein N7473_010921 [Penicillium subrubescens]|uniref:uncharacterized protein n=1 Tax=Penicillium subrubescens TaxID=1316194 RepID=UPI00254593A4|nr:uncharacterized protein N7473_010921 [Penicillium subrubescens]KAJ5884035.1 hypothetical protein N7473_010921 [Penicillium subrubescens]
MVVVPQSSVASLQLSFIPTITLLETNHTFIIIDTTSQNDPPDPSRRIQERRSACPLGYFRPNGQGRQGGKSHPCHWESCHRILPRFKRKYDFSKTPREYHIIPLAQVDERFVAAKAANVPQGRDTIARDRLESVATSVQPPPRSDIPLIPRTQIVKTGF